MYTIKELKQEIKSSRQDALEARQAIKAIESMQESRTKKSLLRDATIRLEIALKDLKSFKEELAPLKQENVYKPYFDLCYNSRKSLKVHLSNLVATFGEELVRDMIKEVKLHRKPRTNKPQTKAA